MTRFKVIAKKHFKTKIEITGSGSRLHLKNARSEIMNMFQLLKYDAINNFEIADRTLMNISLVGIFELIFQRAFVRFFFKSGGAFSFINIK